MHAMEIEGIIQLHDRVHVPDLRAGATMVLWSIGCNRTTKITNTSYDFDRGYEELIHGCEA